MDFIYSYGLVYFAEDMDSRTWDCVQAMLYYYLKWLTLRWTETR